LAGLHLHLTPTEFEPKFRLISCRHLPSFALIYLQPVKALTTEVCAGIQPGVTMQSITNIKSISYLKSHAAQISEDLARNGTPFVITQNGEASMVIEGVKEFQEKEALIATLKIIALGEKDRTQHKGISAKEARAQLQAARQRRK
jgi:hypothetical protein